MKLTITSDQSDALYGLTLDRLSGIGDLEVVVSTAADSAAELKSEYSDDLRLFLDDLAFGPDDGESVVLSSPPHVLRRVLPQLREQAEKHTDGRIQGWAKTKRSSSATA